MSTSRFFWIWAIRSRVIAFLGVVVAIISFWSDAVSQLECAGLISLFGMVLTTLGVLDAFGMFQSEKVKLAIQAHDRKVRGL